MKKRIIAALLTMLLAFSLTACGGSSEDTSDENTEAPVEEVAEETEEAEADDGIIDFEGETFRVTYTKHELGTDYEGNPCLYYYFNFTNNGEEATSAMVTSYIQCFQNGIECETAITDEMTEAMDNYMKDIQPGVTLEVCTAFVLSDNSDVTLEASDWVSLSDDKDVQVLVLE